MNHVLLFIKKITTETVSMQIKVTVIWSQAKFVSIKIKIKAVGTKYTIVPKV